MTLKDIAIAIEEELSEMELEEIEFDLEELF